VFNLINLETVHIKQPK